MKGMVLEDFPLRSSAHVYSFRTVFDEEAPSDAACEDVSPD
jgi:hypothetical protein